MHVKSVRLGVREKMKDCASIVGEASDVKDSVASRWL